MLKVAINGYGRIGRNVHRQFLTRYAGKVSVEAINASSNADMRAYLLKYDSLHHKLNADIEVTDENTITINGKPVKVLKEKDPELCPWKKLGVDIVIESTGKFTTYEKSQGHLRSGAKKVIVTAPMKDDTLTIVKGVNDHLLTPEIDIFSNASCTTNAIAPVIQVIDREFGIEYLLVNSVHAFTASQNLLDNKSEKENDLRRARAATLSVIPTKTSAVKVCGKIFPHLKNKIDGMAFRVPVPTVSCAYMAFVLKKNTTRKEVNNALTVAAGKPHFKEIFSVSADECVSIDFQTDPHSSIIDESFTKIVDGKMLQLLSWYDNEWGYAMRVTELTLKIGDFLK